MHIVEVDGVEVYRTAYGIERAATRFDIEVLRQPDNVQLIEKEIGLGRRSAWHRGYETRKVIYSYNKEKQNG